MSIKSLAAITALLVSAWSPAADAAPPVYRILQPEIARELAATGEAINNNGTVVGRVATRYYSNHRLFMWKPESGLKVIEDSNYGNFENVTGLNDQDQAVGTITHLGPAGVTITDLYLVSRGKLRFGREFVRNVERMAPANINDAGVVPLSALRLSAGAQNFLWTVGQKPTPRSHPDLVTSWINNAGVQVGRTAIYGAFRLDADGVVTELAPLKTNGQAIVIANAINDAGQVVGSSWAQKDRVRSTNAVLWQPSGEIVDLGLLPGEVLCEARRINERGEVVGLCNREDVMPGFYWNSEVGMHRLLDLIDPADPLRAAINTLTAVDINDHGEVLANATTIDGLAYTLVLQPQQAP